MKNKRNLIKHFSNCKDSQKILKPSLKKSLSYFWEPQMAIFFILAIFTGTELFHFLQVDDPFKLVLETTEKSLLIFASYCGIIVFTLMILYIRYGAEDISVIQFVTFCLSCISRIVSNRAFVYVITYIVVSLDAYFANMYIFSYIKHTVLGFFIHLACMIMINTYIAVFAVMAGLCGLLIIAYEVFLIQSDQSNIPKLQN